MAKLKAKATTFIEPILLPVLAVPILLPEPVVELSLPLPEAAQVISVADPTTPKTAGAPSGKVTVVAEQAAHDITVTLESVHSPTMAQSMPMAP